MSRGTGDEGRGTKAVRSRRRLCGAASALVLACAGADSRKAADSAAAVAAMQASSGTGTTCARSATWTPCNLRERLEQSGLVLIPADTVDNGFMHVPDVVWRIGHGELHVFLYADSVAMRRDVSQLDSARAAPPTMMITWIKPPTLITSNNLAVILLSDSGEEIERVTNALTAGLPAIPR